MQRQQFYETYIDAFGGDEAPDTFIGKLDIDSYLARVRFQFNNLAPNYKPNSLSYITGTLATRTNLEAGHGKAP